MNTRKNSLHEQNYYRPSRWLVEYLTKELQSIQPSNYSNIAGGDFNIRFKRDEKTRDARAKNKKDAIDRIFQAFADLIYFLEFIESHHELHQLYQRDLKDLFGLNFNSDITQPHHYQNPGSAFSRFIAASLFNNLDTTQDLDFRTQLINHLIFHAIKGMRMRIDNTNELSLMDSDSNHFWLWGKIMESRAKEDKQYEAKRKFGFNMYRYPQQKEVS
jgi:hypothetical protein